MAAPKSVHNSDTRFLMLIMYQARRYIHPSPCLPYLSIYLPIWRETERDTERDAQHWLELMTLRSRIRHLTDSATQVPLLLYIKALNSHKAPVRLLLSHFTGAGGHTVEGCPKQSSQEAELEIDSRRMGSGGRAPHQCPPPPSL